MKKITLALATTLALSTTAMADTGFYLGGQAGVALINARNLDKHWDEDAPDPEINLNLGSIKKTVFAGAINLGYNFKSQFDVPVRTELSFTARGNMTKDSDAKYDATLGDSAWQKTKVRMNTLMLNSYYDIDTGTSVTPFLTAGLGLAFTKLEGTMATTTITGDETLSKSKTHFAWSLGAGVAYNVMPNLDIDFTARYIDGGKITAKEEDTTTKAKLRSVDMMIGVRYTF